MEPITFTAIVAAVSAGVVSGTSAVGKEALVDAYHKLKDALKRRYGEDSEAVKAVCTVEEDPNSDWRQGMLNEKLERAGADKDPEVQKAAEELMEQVKRQPGGERHVHIIRGNYNAMADRGSSASVRVNRPNEQQ